MNNETCIIPHLFELPPFIMYEGCEFQLQIFINGTRDIRLCYSLESVEENSRHYENYKVNFAWENDLIEKGYTCGFLYLVENISTDKDFLEAIDSCYRWLVKHKIIEL